MKRLKRIFIEVERVRVVCRQSQTYATVCAGCGGAEVDLVTFPEAAKIVGESVDAIIEQAAKGKIHLGIRPEALLLCLNSLLRVKEFSLSIRGVHKPTNHKSREIFH